MAVLKNGVWHSVVIDFGCISSRILWIKFKFSRIEVCVVVVVRYGPNEWMVKKCRGFGITWIVFMDRIGNRCRLFAERSEWICWRLVEGGGWA